MKSDQHPYCYPGTDVLRNKLDIRDRDDLDRFERLEGRNRAETLRRDLPISVEGFRAIHRHIFENIYDWAGEYRFVATGRTGPFCRPEFIAPEMEKRFSAIHAENDLRGLAFEDFAARAAEHVNELNAIHPFLDGNGRTTRAFLEILAERAGYDCQIVRITPDAWNDASARGFHRQDHKPMQGVIAGALVAREGARETATRGQGPKTASDYLRERERGRDPKRDR